MNARSAKRLAAVLAVIAIGATVIGYAVVARHTVAQPAAAVEKLVIAAPGVPHTSLLRIAAAKGYFADEGLEVSILPTIHGPEAVGFVAQGKADIATAAEVVVVLSIMKGEALGVIANMVGTTQATIVARRDRGISSAADLAQRTIGLTFGTSGDYFLWAHLIRHKVAAKTISFVDLRPDQLPQALADGTVDAVSTWQPWVLKAQSALGESAVSFAGDGTYTETHVLAARNDLLRQRPRSIEKLLRALLKAEQFAGTQPEEAIGIVAESLQMDRSALRAVWKNFDFRVDLQQSQIITLEEQSRWAMARGYVEKRPVPNFLPNLYLQALLAVRPERVTVVR